MQEMEKRIMRKTYLVLLAISFCLVQFGLCAEEDQLALTTNFGPKPRPAAPSEPAPSPAPQAGPVTPATQMLREEAVRRQEAQVVAQQLITEGYKLYYDSKYDEAIAKLEQALKILPRAMATEMDYDRAARGLSDCYTRQADAALRAGDEAKAKQLAKKALEFEPSNRAAENIVVKLKLAEQEKVKKEERAKLEGKKPVTVPEPPALNKTPEFVAKQEQIQKLFREGRILMTSGQYDEAEKRYKQILLLDHYNQDAYRNLQELNQQRRDIAEEGVDATRRQRLWQVSEAWIPSPGAEVKLPQPKEASQPVPVDESAKEKIKRKLATIKFPDIGFREAAISDVVDFLSKESVKYDPDKEGVNIVLGPGLTGSVSTPSAPAAPAPAPEGEGVAPAPAPAPALAPSPAAGGKTITLSLRGVSMEAALKYVTQLAGLKYRVETSAVVLLPSDAVEGEMITRPYKVSPDAIKALMATPTATAPMAPTLGVSAPGGGGVAIGGALPGATPSAGGDLKQFFVDAGVPFPSGSSITYFERASTIYVRNTVENLEIFERVLSTFNVVPSQVEIEAKFIEISQSDLDELGFQWSVGNMRLNTRTSGTAINSLQGGGNASGMATNLPNWITQGLRGANILQGNAVSALLVGGTSGGANFDAVGTFAGVLNGASAQMVINALAQKSSTDVLSAPKVTTISGAQAQIRVVQEFIYPSEYSQPTVADGSVPTPSIPTAFKTREIGVILNVTPTVGADGYTINLTLVPEVSAFLGMLDYSPGVISSLSTGQGGNVISVPYKIWQPLFETRNLTTSVVIWDNQTVVLGGLIREDISKVDDKVPFLGDIPILGRLFRSKVDSRTKRNLLVFVSARLIDPAGNPIHKPEPAVLK